MNMHEFFCSSDSSLKESLEHCKNVFEDDLKMIQNHFIVEMIMIFKSYSYMNYFYFLFLK